MHARYFFTADSNFGKQECQAVYQEKYTFHKRTLLTLVKPWYETEKDFFESEKAFKSSKIEIIKKWILPTQHILHFPLIFLFDFFMQHVRFFKSERETDLSIQIATYTIR